MVILSLRFCTTTKWLQTLDWFHQNSALVFKDEIQQLEKYLSLFHINCKFFASLDFFAWDVSIWLIFVELQQCRFFARLLQLMKFWTFTDLQLRTELSEISCSLFFVLDFFFVAFHKSNWIGLIDNIKLPLSTFLCYTSSTNFGIVKKISLKCWESNPGRPVIICSM